MILDRCRSGAGASGRANGLDVERDLEVVADEHATGFEELDFSSGQSSFAGSWSCTSAECRAHRKTSSTRLHCVRRRIDAAES